MIIAVPVLAEEGALTPTAAPAQQEKKECLLVAMNCGDGVKSGRNKINRIQNEINRGTGVQKVAGQNYKPLAVAKGL